MSSTQPDPVEHSPSEVIEFLTAKEEAARKRAAAADEQAQIAAHARLEAEERLARYGITIDSPDAPFDAAEPDDPDASPEQEITRELAQLAERRRLLQIELKERVADETQLLEELATLEDQIEVTSHACAESARSVIELQKAEGRARHNVQECEAAAGRARRAKARAEARAEEEAEAELRARQRAETEDADAEQIGIERAAAMRTALEQAAMQEEAAQRAAAARAAAQQAAKQRLATEQVLRRHSSARRRPIPPRDELPGAPSEVEAIAAAATAVTGATPELPSSEAAPPADRSEWFAPEAVEQESDETLSDLPLDWLESDLDEVEACAADPASQPIPDPEPATWFDELEDEDEELLAPAPRGGEELEPDSVGTVGMEPEELDPLEQPASRTLFPPDESEEAELWEAALAEAEEEQRAQAEIARLERSAAERAEAERRERRAEARALEEERSRYESAASVPRQLELLEDDETDGLYVGQDYDWEVQAALGVQRKLDSQREELRERGRDGSLEQARASSQAVQALKTRSREGVGPVIQTTMVVALSVVLVAVAVALLLRGGAGDAVSPVSASLPAAGETALVTPAPAPALAPTTTPEAPPEPGPSGQDPALLTEDDWPTWRRYAALSPAPEGRPRIAIVIDDMGIDPRATRDVIELPAPITVSFLPHAARLAQQAATARQAGHELMAHIPMEPIDMTYDPGPNYLGEDQSKLELRARLRAHLDRFDFGIVGINNHMGSRFTRNATGMAIVMSELSKRQMLFLDSRTIEETVGAKTAADFGLPYTVNDIFLDHRPTPESRLEPRGILSQLREVERTARRNGTAVAIGHPNAETVSVLREWIPEAKRRGFVLVPITSVVRYQMAQRAGQVDTLAARN